MAAARSVVWTQIQHDRGFSPQPREAPKGGPAGTSPSPNFVCFEPMAGITDAMNLAHRGLYHELQMLAPGQVWQESFWIRPSGF